MKKLYIESLIEYKNIQVYRWTLCYYVKWKRNENLFTIISMFLFNTKYKKYLVSPYLYQIYEYLIINGAKLQNYWMCKKIRAKYSEHINFSLHNTNKTKYIY